MDRLSTETEFEGRLRIITRITNSESEEKGGFLYFHHVARAAVYWWLCDAADEAKLSDKLVVVCDIAEPAEPSEEPEVAVGGEATVTFPITIRTLGDPMTLADAVDEARRVIANYVARGAEDFEGVEQFDLEIEIASAQTERAEAA